MPAPTTFKTHAQWLKLLEKKRPFTPAQKAQFMSDDPEFLYHSESFLDRFFSHQDNGVPNDAGTVYGRALTHRENSIWLNRRRGAPDDVPVLADDVRRYYYNKRKRNQ